MLKLYDVKTEYRKEPLGMDVMHPCFSWKLSSDQNDVRQKGYRILVSNKKETVWDSAFCLSERSVYVPYEGKALEPKTRYDVSVRVSDSKDEEASFTTFFETGLLKPENFEASFITHGFEDDPEGLPVFKKEFSLDKTIKKARAYVSALGIYSFAINGERVSDSYFAPGWTSYQKRLQYQTYDIASYLKKENVIDITVADGWYKGILGFYNQGNHYGRRTALIAQIEIEYEDGSIEMICTDESWRSTLSVHRYAQIYHGEIIDLSIGEQEEKDVHIFDYPKENLIAQENEPVKITQKLAVQEILHSPGGAIILDFGQNMTGIVEVRTRQPNGTKIVLRHGEMLDENGELFTTNLRTAKATDTFICSGNDDTFLPEFTFHGFRYVAVEGLEDIDPKQFTACVMRSGFEQNNSFHCDDTYIDKLYQNIGWTMRSNYFDVPMDCPQRDERLGYTGDAQIFLPAALFHGDLALFYRKWLNDLKVEQSFGYGVPLTVPDILRTRVCVNIWHDAATFVPWQIYQAYGDLRVLSDQYESMRSAVEFTRKTAGEDILLSLNNSSQFGDWLALDGPKGPFRKPEKVLHPSQDEKIGGTDPYLIGNVYYLASIDILIKSAKLLGKAEDEASYQALYDEVKNAFQEEYISRNGRIVNETQTAAALILYFDLCKEKDRRRMCERLKLNLIKTNKHLRTGFVGTEYLPFVLSDNGMHQLSGDILMKDDCPSWLYEVKLGATTVWELWDGVNPDHSINPFVMNSFNQYGFASIGSWLIQRLAGISALEAGYHKTLIRPRLVRGICETETSYETPYGRLACHFSCRNGKITCDITIPANSSAVLDLPQKETMDLPSGEYHFQYDTDLDYEAAPYSEDSTLKQLLSQPEAKALFAEKAPKLCNDPLINNFAGRMSIAEIKATLPSTMIPEYAYAIFDEMIALLNKKAKEEQQ